MSSSRGRRRNGSLTAALHDAFFVDVEDRRSVAEDAAMDMPTIDGYPYSVSVKGTSRAEITVIAQ
jgi:hypothetical protein